MQISAAFIMWSCSSLIEPLDGDISVFSVVWLLNSQESAERRCSAEFRAASTEIQFLIKLQSNKNVLKKDLLVSYQHNFALNCGN